MLGSIIEIHTTHFLRTTAATAAATASTS